MTATGGATRGIRDILLEPFYPLAEVSRYLAIPRQTLAAWAGRSFIKPMFPASHHGLCFVNLVEAYLISRIRCSHKLPAIRSRIAEMKASGYSNRPTACREFYLGRWSEAVDRVISHVAFDWDTGLPCRLDIPILNQACVRIDPRVSSGQPTVGGVLCNVIWAMTQAGEESVSLADDYRLDHSQVVAAFVYWDSIEALKGNRS